MNDLPCSQHRSSEEIAKEIFPTHGTRMLSENTKKSWGSFLQLASCVIAVSLDPFFLYIPVINHHEKCFHFDKKLRIAALVLRSVTDVIFMLHIAFQFLTGGYVARPIPSHINGVNGYVASLRRAWEILKTYMLTYFFIDILSLLPIPQVAILSIIPEMKGSKSLTARNSLTALVLLQYVPRAVRVFPLYKKLMWTSRIFKETPWTKASLNLFLYMLASHVLGALWYFFSIEREITCWQEACAGHPGCDHSSFFCDNRMGATEFLHDMCPIETPDTNLFDFGIFLDALQSGIVESVNLPQKLFRCLWWGLQNMSSFGQNLKTSTYVWENIFAVFISTFGLVLFLYFIENMQSNTIEKKRMRMEMIRESEELKKEIRSKAQAVDSWMSNYFLPEPIKRRIKHSIGEKWHEITTVDLEIFFQILPVDLEIDIKRHICSTLVKRVPVLALMDDQLLDVMRDRLDLMAYSAEKYVIQKGDQVEKIFFIFRGKVLSWLTNANVERTDFSLVKQTGDCCGEELLTWVFNGGPLTNLPISNETAKTLTKVEAYTLTAEDLKFLISKFQLLHGVKLRRILRYYSQKWRTWAARVIQMAWRHYAKKKLKELLGEEEMRLQDALVETIIKAMHLQKPAEPDFLGEDSSYMWR